MNTELKQCADLIFGASVTGKVFTETRKYTTSLTAWIGLQLWKEVSQKTLIITGVEGKETQTYALQTGLKSLISTCSIKISEPPLHK